MALELDMTMMAVAGALALRFGILSATLPLLEVRTVPPLWRIALAICFAAALTPAVSSSLPMGAISLSWEILVLEGLRSLVIGAVLGFTVNLIFTAVRYAGSVAGMQVGFAIVNAYDPLSNSQISVISQFYYLMAVLIFFVTGTHHVLVSAMFQSCIVAPPFTALDPTAGAWHLLREFSTVFSIGLRIAGPIVIVLLLVSGSMGVIVKTVPQINILVVGFPIKIGVGVITLGLSLVFFKEATVGLMGEIEQNLSEALLALR